ncbi:type II secretion system F family protein [Variovorax guangxiensis]|uniref:type II secretion system F family protein n=1 Tax=Variovorax guangxiensis TaxID=1775474 RepID=UPI002863570A|nr:type II secretion system F family protein [Variovorax guangxiensis]MDR6857406.1 tight adherence protein B [Variovorax guangxiensis]
MLQNLGGNVFVIISALVFVAVLLLLEGLYLIWKSYKGPEAKQVEKRLRALSAAHDSSDQAQLVKERLMSEVPALQRLLLKAPRAHVLDRFILQAGLDTSVSVLLLWCAAGGVLGLSVVAGALHQSWAWGLACGAVLAMLPLMVVQHLRARRLGRLERQLPEALDLVVRALRSGHSFASGLQMIGEEMAEPIANEFRIVSDEVNFGVSLQQALTNLSERVPLTDLRYFVVAVMIQRESGGNLTEVLANLSRLIRERLKLFARIKVLSSEGRLSAWILGVMPFALAALLNTFNPGFMSPLWTDPIGISIVKYMLVLMAIGVVILVKIVKIRV